MQMVSICICMTDADVRHMDMPHLYELLTFSTEIRFLPVPDLPIVIPRTAALKHKMWYVVSCIFFYMLCYPPAL